MTLEPNNSAGASPNPPGVLICQWPDSELWLALQMPESYLIACAHNPMTVTLQASEWFREMKKAS